MLTVSHNGVKDLLLSPDGASSISNQHVNVAMFQPVLPQVGFYILTSTWILYYGKTRSSKLHTGASEYAMYCFLMYALEIMFALCPIFRDKISTFYKSDEKRQILSKFYLCTFALSRLLSCSLFHAPELSRCLPLGRSHRSGHRQSVCYLCQQMGQTQGFLVSPVVVREQSGICVCVSERGSGRARERERKRERERESEREMF